MLTTSQDLWCTSNDLRCFSQWPLKTGRAASSRPLTRKGDPATHLVGGKRGIQTQVGLVSKPWLLTAIVHCPSVPGTGKGVPWWPGVKHLQCSEAFSSQCSGSAGIGLSEGFTVFANRHWIGKVLGWSVSSFDVVEKPESSYWPTQYYCLAILLAFWISWLELL